MNRKRMAAALLLCLTLLCGCARADWADDTADALAIAICHAQAAGTQLRNRMLNQFALRLKKQ